MSESNASTVTQNKRGSASARVAKTSAASETKTGPKLADVTRIGNLTTDPELRFTPNGVAVAALDLAYQPYDVATKQRGETVFYHVTVWRDLGEHVAESLHKGDRVIVVGTPSVRDWEDRDGNKRQTREITASAIGPDLRWSTATVTRRSTNASSSVETSEEIPEDF